MKSSTLFANTAAALALTIAVHLWFNIRQVRQENEVLQTALHRSFTARPAAVAVEEGDLMDIMNRLQRYATKLHVSGKNENWDLAGYYVEELEQVVSEAVPKDIMLGQINVSGLMQGLIMPETSKLETIIQVGNRPGFLQAHQALTAACNACHSTTSHGFIVIQEPRTPIADDQNYEALKILPAVGTVPR